VQLPAVKLQADDGKHEDSKKEQQADLEERHHGLHDGFQHNLQAWDRKERAQLGKVMQTPCLGHVHPTSGKRRAVSGEDGQSPDRCKRPAEPAGCLWAGEDHGSKAPSQEEQGGPGCRARLWGGLFLDLVSHLVFCLSLSQLALVGRGPCSSIPPIAPAHCLFDTQGRSDRRTGAGSSLVSLFIPMPADEILQKK